MKKYILSLIVVSALALPLSNVSAGLFVTKNTPSVPLVSAFADLKAENKKLQTQVNVLQKQVAKKYTCHR